MSLIDIYESNFKNGNYNLGSMFMDCMLRKPKEQICQIDAAIEASETCGSVFSRSVRLARCLSRLGLRPGDVLALGGRNHLDLQIPCYAAMLNGLPVVGVDPYFKYAEIKVLLKLTEPKIAFCQQETQADYARAAEELGIELTIVTFDGECTLNQFMDTYGEDNQAIEEFQPAVFDTEKVYAWLVSTSGTSGLPKIAALKHADLIKQILVYTRMVHKSKKHGEVALNLSPVQWISSYFNSIGMLLSDNCRVQTSTPDSIEHIIDIINKYRPISLFTGPSLVTAILKHDKECDMSCFDVITLTGAKIFKDMMIEFKSRLRPDTVVYETYGQTETIGPALLPNPRGPIGSCGICIPGVKVKLVDPNSGNEITEPNVPGELWYKGPLFSEYYNDPEETAKAFSEDGFFKTGDLLYRDEQQNYYFMDRLKMLIKYRSYHILPPELEEVIFSHPGVLDVGVVGIPHPEDGQHPVACVVRRPSCDVTAQEIKDLVIAKLSASKQLRGGVVFLDELPKTSTGKVARAKLMEIVINILNDKN